MADAFNLSGKEARGIGLDGDRVNARWPRCLSGPGFLLFLGLRDAKASEILNANVAYDFDCGYLLPWFVRLHPAIFRSINPI